MNQRPPQPALSARRAYRACGLLAVLAVAFWSQRCPGQDGEPAPEPAAEAEGIGPDAARRVGRLIRIPAPISNNVKNRAVRMAKSVIADASRNQERPLLIFEIEPGSCSFGAALDLADEITRLNGATTVAYVPNDKEGKPQVLRGHAVLVAMACDMIAMSEGSRIGEAGADEENIGPHVRSGYAHIAKARQTVPEDLALGMLDPDLEVWEVETSEVSREFVRGERLEALKQEKTVKVLEPPVIPRGTAGLFSGEEAKRLGIVRFTVPDRHALARQLGLPPEALEEDPSLAGGWRSVEIRVAEQLTPKYVRQVQRKLQEQINKHDVNLIVLSVDSPGGSPADALELAASLSVLDQGERRTVAYITSEASGDAAFIALACDRIVMFPGAVLGGPVRLEDKTQATTLRTAVESVAREKGRTYSLWTSLLAPDMTVYRYQRKSDGLVAYFSEAEAAAQPDADDWQQGQVVVEPGKPLQPDGTQALELGMATDLVDNYEELKSLYGLEEDPKQVEPNWVDTITDALTNQGVLMALLMIGWAAFYGEMHSPGTGVGGFLATICFLLFFWGTYLGGTAGWLELLLFGGGMVFILLEVFVLPGFGIFGIGGGVMVLLSLLMAMQSFTGLPTTPEHIRELRDSLTVLAGSAIGVALAIGLMRRLLPASAGFNRLVLEPPGGGEPQGETDKHGYGHLLGERGVAVTRLRPGGKIRIGDDVLNVVSDGDPIEPGQTVVVAEVRGSRIVVHPAE